MEDGIASAAAGMDEFNLLAASQVI